MTISSMRPFSVGETVFPIRDMEMSDKGTVLGYEESDRGFVLVRFEDGIPRALPIASVKRAGDRKHRPIGQGEIWAESTSLGDYLRRMGEADSGILTKERK